MTSVFAHGTGSDALPMSRWLLAYLLAFVVVLVFLGLRLTATSGRARAPEEPITLAPAPLTGWLLGTRLVGILLFLSVFGIAAFSRNANGNLATILVTIVFWLGGLALAAVIGDWYWPVNPLDTVAAAFFRSDERRPHRGDAPPWTSAVLLFGFLWFWFIYSFRTPTNSDVAGFLAVYTVLVLAGAGLWGRRWIRNGEAFGAVFALLGRRLRAAPGPAGAAALAAVLLGGIAYDGMSQTTWWLDIVGDRDGNALRAVGTIGLLWTTAIVGAAYLATIWLVERVSDSERTRTELADRYAVVLIPFGAAGWLLHELPTFLVDIQNGIALASDPLGRGWDLFGTINHAVDYELLTPTQQSWIQIGLLVAGSVAAAVMIHRITFACYQHRVALRVIYPLEATLVIATVAASGLLLGT